MPTATTYHVVAPCPFSRREGPWPRRAFQPAERQRIFRDTAQRLEDQLEQYGLFRWYRDVAGVKRDPRRKKKGEPHAFGLVPLVLTPAQFQRLRRAMPEVLTLPRRPFRIPKPGRLASSTNIVPNASEANFWHIPAIGLDTARTANPHRLGQGIKVAVIDSGVDRIHREFSGKTIEAIEFDSVTGKFLRFGGSDDDGHGTHVASLIAGEKAGVAPQADLVSVSVFRNRQAQPEAVVAALAWVKEQHVHVINLSAGFRPNTEVFASVVNQILQAGILVVCASGNSANICTSPGDYDAVLTVGASTPSGTAWRGAAGEGSGSGKARTAPFSVVPDLLAPGVEVWGAWPGDRYRALTGTSMAAPIVSGLAALEYQKRNALVAVDQVIFNLMGSADPAPDSLRSRNGLVRA